MGKKNTLNMFRTIKKLKSGRDQSAAIRLQVSEEEEERALMSLQMSSIKPGKSLVAFLKKSQ